LAIYCQSQYINFSRRTLWVLCLFPAKKSSVIKYANLPEEEEKRRAMARARYQLRKKMVEVDPVVTNNEADEKSAPSTVARFAASDTGKGSIIC